MTFPISKGLYADAASSDSSRWRSSLSLHVAFSCFAFVLRTLSELLNMDQGLNNFLQETHRLRYDDDEWIPL